MIMFLTDGQPTLPLENSQLQNAKMAIQQAVRAAKFDIRIDTFAIGEEALSEPVVVVEMARVSNGVFTPVRHPQGPARDLRGRLLLVDREARGPQQDDRQDGRVHRCPTPDGSFTALVPMKEGKNTRRGLRALDRRHRRAPRGDRELPARRRRRRSSSPRQVAQRNRLLENRLLDLQRRNVEIQAEAKEDMRRELQVEIEKERKAAEESTAKVRKDVQVSGREREGEARPSRSRTRARAGPGN